MYNYGSGQGFGFNQSDLEFNHSGQNLGQSLTQQGVGQRPGFNQSLGGNRHGGAIQKALTRFDSQFQQVDLNRNLGNATQFGTPGLGFSNAINHSLGRFDDAFDDSNNKFGRRY